MAQFPPRPPRWTIMAAALLLGATAGRAVPTPEASCQAGRELAAGKFALCTQKALRKYEQLGAVLGALEDYNQAVGRCVAKYSVAWTKLQAKAAGTGSTCDNPRLVDNGDGTVTDRLTGLQWERKTNLDSTPNASDPHDVDNLYAWSAGGLSGTAADGTVFTSFLATLNGGCFAGHCDWQLPTRDQLQTIVSPPHPNCAITPCIDPTFGPTLANTYWSATTEATLTTFAWGAGFQIGGGGLNGATKTGTAYVRAVRFAF